MPNFVSKLWKAKPDASTPLNAAGLNDIEARIAALESGLVSQSDGRYIHQDGTGLPSNLVTQKSGVSIANIGPWLGLNGNSLSGYGALSEWPAVGVVYDRLEFIQPASCTGTTASGQSVATAVSNGMIPVVLIEPSGYGAGSIPTGGAITTFANYVVAQIQAVEAANPTVPTLYEIVNEPWTTSFWGTPPTVAQHADVISGVWDACIAAGLDMTRIYAQVQNATWLAAMYAQQSTLGSKVKGWALHPYGAPPPGYASSTGQGIAWVPEIRKSMTSGANNILISEIGVWDYSVSALHSTDESTALDTATAKAWMLQILQQAQRYRSAGWLKALLVYNRNSGGWATNAAGGALTSVGTALTQWMQQTDPAVTSGYSVTDDGWVAVNLDPAIASEAVQLTGGKLHLMRVRVDKRQFAQNLIVYVDTAGATLTASQCYAGIYDALGNRLDVTTSDQVTNWQGTGVKTMGFGGDNFKPGFYYIGLLANGTTMPKFRGKITGDQVNIGSGSALPTRSMISTASFTTLPSSINLSSGVARSSSPILVALST